jgi:hypothetical protein
MGQHMALSNEIEACQLFCRAQLLACTNSNPRPHEEDEHYLTGLTTMIKDPNEKVHVEWGGTQGRFIDRAGLREGKTSEIDVLEELVLEGVCGGRQGVSDIHEPYVHPLEEPKPPWLEKCLV